MSKCIGIAKNLLYQISIYTRRCSTTLGWKIFLFYEIQKPSTINKINKTFIPKTKKKQQLPESVDKRNFLERWE